MKGAGSRGAEGGVLGSVAGSWGVSALEKNEGVLKCTLLIMTPYWF